MGNLVTNVCAKFNYDWLRIDKVLGNWKCDNGKKKKKDNVHIYSALVIYSSLQLLKAGIATGLIQEFSDEANFNRLKSWGLQRSPKTPK